MNECCDDKDCGCDQTVVESATIISKRVIGTHADGTPFEFKFYRKDGDWVDSPPEMWGDQ